MSADISSKPSQDSSELDTLGNTRFDSIGSKDYPFPEVDERVLSYLMNLKVSEEEGQPSGTDMKSFIVSVVEKLNIILSFCTLMVSNDVKKFPRLPPHSNKMVPFFMNMKLRWTLDRREEFVRVGPSQVHGNGVFCKKHMEPGAVLTMYPVDVVIFNDKEIIHMVDGGGTTYDQSMAATRRTLDYLIIAPEKNWCAGGDPLHHDPFRCGHLINDARGTEHQNNCTFQMILDGIMVCITATKEISPGEELFMSYGDSYWDARRES